MIKINKTKIIDFFFFFVEINHRSSYSIIFFKRVKLLMGGEM